MRPHRSDAGVAAVELAIFMTLFIALIGLVAPLAYLLYESVQLGRTAGDVVRFASSRTDGDRIVDGSTTVQAGDLPSFAATAIEANRAFTGLGTATLMPPSAARPFRAVSSGSGCPSGRRVYVTLTTTVDLGPFAGFLVSGSTRTLTAQATSCEE